MGFPAYHGIMFHHFHDDDLHLNGQGSINRDIFEQTINFLKTNYNILKPEDFQFKALSNKLSSRDIVITFDDALKCQYDIAAKVLDTHNLKAYFFVYSSAFTEEPDYLEYYREFRNSFFKNVDEFYEVFFNKLKILNKNLFDIYESRFNESYLSEFKFYSLTDRKFRFVRDNILTNYDYKNIMLNLFDEFNYDITQRKKHLFMSLENLISLNDRGHTIGLHSHSHPTRIDKLSILEQENEYMKNINFLADKLKLKPTSMSHPCGRYNKETLDILLNAGIEIGFRDNMESIKDRSLLEIPRLDHTNLVKEIGLKI